MFADEVNFSEAESRVAWARFILMKMKLHMLIKKKGVLKKKSKLHEIYFKWDSLLRKFQRVQNYL